MKWLWKYQESTLSLHSCVSFYSLFLRAPPSGVGHWWRYCCCGHPPHYHRVMQEVQAEETEARRKRGGSQQREKRPHCVVRPRERETQGEEEGDRERKRRIAHFLSRSPSDSGDRGMWCSLLGPGSLFLLDVSLPPSSPTTVFGSQTWTSWRAAVIEKN